MAKTDDDLLAALEGVRIGSVPPPPKAVRRKTYAPKAPPSQDVIDAVWDSYQTGDWKIVPVPDKPELIQQMRDWLLSAKNYLAWKHGIRDGIRGLEKADVTIMNLSLMTDQEREMYGATIPEGHVGIRFRAHPVMLKGMRARAERIQREAAEAAKKENES